MLNSTNFSSPNWVFVSYDYGAGGHRLARKICCLPKMYWYSTKGNGKRPWNTNSYKQLPKDSFLRKLREIAPAHYSQMTPRGILPFDYSIGCEYIEDEDQYYELFEKRFVDSGGHELLKTNRVVYISHGQPKDTVVRFPNAKVISVVDDPKNIADRYMYTTALFPADISMAFQWLPNLTKTSSYLLTEMLNEKYGNITMRDLWSYKTHKTMWDEKYVDEYYNVVYNYMKDSIERRLSFKHDNVLTVKKTETTKIKNFLMDGYNGY
jgi:hypothetical protein